MKWMQRWDWKCLGRSFFWLWDVWLNCWLHRRHDGKILLIQPIHYSHCGSSTVNWTCIDREEWNRTKAWSGTAPHKPIHKWHQMTVFTARNANSLMLVCWLRCRSLRVPWKMKPLPITFASNSVQLRQLAVLLLKYCCLCSSGRVCSNSGSFLHNQFPQHLYKMYVCHSLFPTRANIANICLHYMHDVAIFYTTIAINSSIILSIQWNECSVEIESAWVEASSGFGTSGWTAGSTAGTMATSSWYNPSTTVTAAVPLLIGLALTVKNETEPRLEVELHPTNQYTNDIKWLYSQQETHTAWCWCADCAVDLSGCRGKWTPYI